MDKADIYSFDIFDTLITRATATPEGVFALMQQRLMSDAGSDPIDSHIRENFFRLRIQAEKLAYREAWKQGREEITLEEIYRMLSRTGCLTDWQRELLMELECQTELEISIGIPANIALVLEKWQQGRRVLLVSDMYLDAETLRGMLEKADARLAELPLIVSSEWGATKSGGGLYRKLLRENGEGALLWRHYGDNVHSDVEVPMRLGICAERVVGKILLPCEQAALAGKEQDSFLQLTLGASANARLLAGVSAEKASPYAYGSSLGGCIAYPYVWWIVSQSVQKGIKRLYFIARDAYLLKAMADDMIERHHLPLETHYLYGSRKTWRVGALSESFWDISLLFHWSSPDKLASLQGIARVLETAAEELLPFLPESYRRCVNVETMEQLRFYTQWEIRQLAKYWDTCSGLRQFLSEQCREKRELAVSYLRQEIDVTDENFAFVELIGSGCTQVALSKLMGELTEAPVHTFFYHLDDWLETDQCKFFCYMPAAMPQSGLMELLYTAPHGHTVGYRCKGHKMIPVLDAENKVLQEYGLSEYQRGVLDFIRLYGEQAAARRELLENGSLSMFYRRYMGCGADAELLEYLGDMPFGASGIEKSLQRYAPKLTEEDLKKIYLMFKGAAVRKVYEGENFELSLQRCTEEDWRLIEKYRDMWDTEEAERERLCYRQRHGMGPAEAFDFPLSMLTGKVVLYGAGKFGKRLKREIEYYQNTLSCQVVQWIDKALDGTEVDNCRIEGIESIGIISYDCLVIAILDRQKAEEAEWELIERGVPKEKIICGVPQVKW